MKAPSPAALRLHTLVRDAKRTTVPFGLSGWNENATDIAVLLQPPTDDGRSLAQIAAQLPDATTLPTDATVVVLARAVRNATSWRRWLGQRVVPVPRALRCSALLVRGYVDIGAAIGQRGEDLVWGRAGRD